MGGHRSRSPDRLRRASQHQSVDAGVFQIRSNAPESSAIAGEIRRLLAAALLELPVRQREVVSLRDVQGLPADEVCRALGVTATNQRVLLHRGQARLRAALADYYQD